MKKLLYILFVFPCLLLAQNTDSLKLALKNSRNDSVRCNVLNAMIEAEGDDNVWSKYNEQLLKLAEKKLSENPTPDLRMFYLKHIAAGINNLGFLEDIHGNAMKAIEYWKKSLKIQEEIKDKQGQGTSLNNIGQFYSDQGDILRSLEYHHKSLKIREEIQDKSGIAYSLNNIGQLYETQGDIAKALEYYFKAVKILREIDEKSGITTILNNIGAIYNSQGNFSTAVKYFEESLKIRKETQDRNGIAQSLNNLGAVFYEHGDMSKALEYYNEGLKICENEQYMEGVAHSLNFIAAILMKKGLENDALSYASRSFKISQKLGYPELINSASENLKKIYEAQHKYKEAFEMYELEIKMRDSISNQETQKASVKKQMQYEFEKEEAIAKAEHKSELEKQQAVADEKQRKQKIVIGSVIAGLVLVLVFAMFIFRSLRITRKQKILIEIKNKETETQKEIIEEKQKEILDSIHYAKRIQTALITNEQYFEKNLRRLTDG